MPHRHPTVWLMTDPRLGEALLDAVRRLPPRAGVVWRGGAWADYRAVRRVVRARRLVIVSKGRRLPGADGVHNGRGTGIRTRAAHDARELDAAIRARADMVFVSPVFATRSHPEGATLGMRGFARLAARAPIGVIALGGLTPARFIRLRRHGADGWAAIDAWLTK